MIREHGDVPDRRVEAVDVELGDVGGRDEGLDLPYGSEDDLAKDSQKSKECEHLLHVA